jgi:hypothetical protein
MLARRMYMVTRYALLLVPFAFASAAAFVPTLFTQKYIAVAVIITCGIFLAGALMFFLSTKK